MRFVPHFLTLLRLIAAPFIALLLVRAQFRAALIVVFCAGLTDWFDGFAARRLGVSGKTGVILDPLADKTLLVTLFLVAGFIGLIPVWLVALVIGRDVVIVVGALVLSVTRNIRSFRPSTLGKVSTFFQIVLVLMVLLEAAFPNRVFYWLCNCALLLCAIFTALSGIDYVRRGMLAKAAIDGARGRE